MTWQDWVRQNLPQGTMETSGYRTPQQEAALGGPASSYHTRGTAQTPGAIDVGGPAAALRQLFDEIKVAFAGRINELYLNIPGGHSADIRNNQAISYNPEAGRPQHLHIALGATVGPPTLPPVPGTPTGPAGAGGPPQAPWEAAVGNWLRGIRIPTAPGVSADTGTSMRAPGAASECERSFSFPLGGTHCWSDVWFYGAAVGAVLGGVLLLFSGAKGR